MMANKPSTYRFPAGLSESQVHIIPTQPDHTGLAPKWKDWFRATLEQLPDNHWLVIERLSFTQAQDFQRWANWWCAKRKAGFYAVCLVQPMEDNADVFQFSVTIQYGAEG